MIWRHGTLVAEVRTEPAGRVALLHLDATQPVVLDGTAAAIWELIDGRRDHAEVIAELEAAFEDAAGQLAHQVEAFLASLEAQRLIEAAHKTSH
ncbi:pyrroloquinoline quinone biosynthesis peptide chaperone PqqD [Arthrobacter oryzae]|jgi:coenzyme PQQ biosynthesis protein PqqD|uniref:pyrroloquinoline quinone biosynthesis peptide chaperone PqqD n=1 Tax=Arthrobacter oryzae TaxID=409290 RepID=UPI00277EA616|nr:pyrroloquinoline quinone biosynthesis peptide chaperone PqqD [Arthrobacter oryzae]MDQ0078453.1 pyrroloquinoline quinone biosynthesis protein D [Arthrobacter oryzae]